MNLIYIKPDKRFKPGNIKQVGDNLRGNPETVSISRVDTTNAPLEMQLNPPLQVTAAMALAMEKAGMFS